MAFFLGLIQTHHQHHVERLKQIARLLLMVALYPSPTTTSALTMGKLLLISPAIVILTKLQFLKQIESTVPPMV